MKYRRTKHPGGIYFFTLNLKNRNSNLLIQEIAYLRLAFKKTKIKYPFNILGIVILPEHLHMLMKLPNQDIEYPVRIRLLKSYFSYQVQSNEEKNKSRLKKQERSIWQRRYWEHAIRDEKDYENHLNYIYYNPVKHGYVKTPAEWPYSSLHRDIKLGLYPENWTCEHQPENMSFGE